MYVVFNRCWIRKCTSSTTIVDIHLKEIESLLVKAASLGVEWIIWSWLLSIPQAELPSWLHRGPEGPCLKLQNRMGYLQASSKALPSGLEDFEQGMWNKDRTSLSSPLTGLRPFTTSNMHWRWWKAYPWLTVPPLDPFPFCSMLEVLGDVAASASTSVTSALFWPCLKTQICFWKNKWAEIFILGCLVLGPVPPKVFSFAFFFFYKKKYQLTQEASQGMLRLLGISGGLWASHLSRLR